MSVKHRKFRIYLLSTLAGMIFAGASLLLFSFLIWVLQLPVELSDTFSLLALSAGCLASGITAGRLKKTGGLIIGVKSALTLFFISAAATFVTGGFSGEFFIGRLSAAVLCGAVGGIIGVNKKQ